jgi:superfamily II DNA or RNA helicase
MRDVREVTQKAAEEAWISSGRKNTVIIATGGGKSRLALNIIKRFDYTSILLLTNATQLRDVNWKDEFDKFGMSEYWSRVNSQTYQAMYNKEWDSYGLIILDEIDYIGAGPQYSKCLEQAQKHGTNVLGLTGFATEDKREVINQYFPICYEVSREEMQEDQLLNKSEFIFIEFPLSKEKTIEQKLKKGGTFKVSENDQYAYWDKKFQQAMMVKQTLYKKYRQEFTEPEGQKDYQSAEWNFKLTATKRKAILHNLNSSVKVVEELLKHIHSEEGNKVIIFSANTNQANKMINPYHSKSEGIGLEDLNSGKINTMTVVKKITRGVNLHQVQWAIRESFDGSEETFQQSLGRLLRLKPDQVAKYIILLPLVECMVRDTNGVFRKQLIETQAHKWVEKMLTSAASIKPRVIRLNTDYKLKDGIKL